MGEESLFRSFPFPLEFPLQHGCTAAPINDWWRAFYIRESQVSMPVMKNQPGSQKNFRNSGKYIDGIIVDLYPYFPMNNLGLKTIMGILLGGVFALALIGIAFDFVAFGGGQAKTFTVSSAATPAYQTSVAGNAARAAQTLQASRAAAAEAARQAQAAQEASASQAAAADGSTTADLSAAGYTEEEILAYLAANGYDLSGYDSGGGSGDYYIPPSTGFSPWTGNNGETWASGNASW